MAVSISLPGITMSHISSLGFLLCLSLLASCGDTGNFGPPDPTNPLPDLRAVPDPLKGGRIIDRSGREVLLRGVNVNSFVDYWQYDEDLFTTYPFTTDDADAIAAMGWNTVRLLVSWSRIEPAPGKYDEGYLDEVASAIAMLRERGVYTLLDLHQDAWGPSLAAGPDELCDGDSVPAGGWDGAPEWATLDGGEPRCASGPREFVPAVVAAWRSFLDNATGPGGVGIQTRYVQMFAHLVARFADDGAVFGYDLMNEPNVFDPLDQAILSTFYENAIAAMRKAEQAVNAPRRFLYSSQLQPGGSASLPHPRSSTTTKSSTRLTSTRRGLAAARLRTDSRAQPRMPLTFTEGRPW